MNDWLNQTKSGHDFESSSFVIVANRVDDSVSLRLTLASSSTVQFFCISHVTHHISISHYLDVYISFHAITSSNLLPLLNMNIDMHLYYMLCKITPYTFLYCALIVFKQRSESVNGGTAKRFHVN